jgi:glycolate oxidase iron-sulfur subunit
MSTPPLAPTDERRKSRYDMARDCVHCGLCLQACPTYVTLGNEADSPRGRIYLMRAHEEGKQPNTAAFREHLDLCLVCRACETACPSGVQFGSMMEEFRALEHEASAGSRGITDRFKAALGQWMLLGVLPHRRRLRGAVTLLRFYQATGLERIVRASGLLRALGLEERAALAPRVPPAKLRRDWPETLPALGPRRARVLFVRGCVTPELLPEMQRASIEALRHNGCEVVTPRRQTCCGALHFHSGYRREGFELLARNLESFDARDVDAIVVNAAGCGSTLKEYGALAAERRDLEPAARGFAGRVRDISEFLDELGLTTPPHSVPARVVYDEPCHLLHGQGVSAAPKRILDAIPGLQRLPLVDADRCCGSAGVYNVLHPEMANAILREKVQHIVASGADTVATGNSGCILQLRGGLREAVKRRPELARVRVVHPMQLLAQAYAGGAA